MLLVIQRKFRLHLYSVTKAPETTPPANTMKLILFLLLLPSSFLLAQNSDATGRNHR